MTDPAPAGWYADPSGLPALRWWDGREWTAHLQPGGAAMPPTTISAGWRGGLATKPAGEPVPGPHTAEPSSGEIFAPHSAEITAPSITTPAAPLPASPGYAHGGAFLSQPVDSVSAQLGYTTPAGMPAAAPSAPPAASGGRTDPGPEKRTVVVGAVSLVINPLLLCSLYAIVMGLRAIRESAPGSPARRNGTFAVALGAGGVLTQIGYATALYFLL
ncbi:DUF2510 domain-containing protein [Actinoplanes aureus]|uniref:DUF2510 domain-containing protein n=1 Tax=Actinoplanes aureus TaxID=2792083 RepID=A0A931C8P0_9ACTN|nr:DUF2510 domain-containing protein [Actinoplanes aureus]MBG0562538.1 DUF2510 domain-containing protein [Actinoplanes aureus]